MHRFSIVAPTASADGYGASAEGLVLAAVRNHGADIAFVEHDWRDARFSDPALIRMLRHESVIEERDVLVVYFLPYGLARYRAKFNISQTMWETDRLPDAWARIINDMANGVIVPSEHCRQVFADRVDVPIAAVPLGTDTSLYTFHARDPSGECIFLMSGLLHYRKGVDFALRAFYEEFQGDEAVQLWLKTRRGFLDPVEEWKLLGDDRVVVIDEDYTREQMVALYHGVDCLLAPSRGEGSGLTPRDAMSTGLPVVMTDWSGLAEIADDRYGYPVSVDTLERAPAENSSYGQGVTGGGGIGNFARPSIAELRAAMRSVYEDRPGAYARGSAAATWVREKWSWERCAGDWLEAIDGLVGAKAAVR